jgi:hypothetical protein
LFSAWGRPLAPAALVCSSVPTALLCSSDARTVGRGVLAGMGDAGAKGTFPLNTRSMVK